MRKFVAHRSDRAEQGAILELYRYDEHKEFDYFKTWLIELKEKIS